MSVTISNTTATKTKLPFLEIKNSILGKDYELSLALIGEVRARQINKTFRQATYTPNVLSFSLGNKTGEIYLTPQVAKREAFKFDHSFKKHLIFLYIHGLLHLKGLDHGKKMDQLEEKYLRLYS